MTTNLNSLAQEIYTESVNKGWYETHRSPLEFHMLIVSEISEATEEVRNGRPTVYEVEGKPEGEAVELVDALIRILDYCAYRKIDIDNVLKSKLEYNKKRSYRHGNKLY